jgi:hypothetical protein
VLRQLLSVLALGGVFSAAPIATQVAQAASPPMVLEAWSTDVTISSATLHARIDPLGSATSYRFEYLSESAYQANLGNGVEPFAGSSSAPAAGEVPIGSGLGAIGVTQQLHQLSPGTPYRYRVLAKNTGGNSPGAILSFTTQHPESGPLLADGRGWELVSPEEKNGGGVAAPEALDDGGVLQAAAAGGAITYSSASSFGSEARGAPSASQYLSHREESGWSTENLTIPTVGGAYGDHPDGVPYQLFSADLRRSAMLEGEECPPSCGRGYLLSEEGAQPLQTPRSEDLRLAGASTDLESVVFSTCRALTSDAVEVPAEEGCDPHDTNLYLVHDGQLQLLNIIAGDSVGEPFAHLASSATAVADSRVYWTMTGELYVWEAGGCHQLAEANGGEFEGATGDGAFAFFENGGELYRYDAASKTSEEIPLLGSFEGVLGASKDGGTLYYATSAGLYVWRGGESIKIAAAADPSDFRPGLGTARVSADGSRLLFLSRSRLSGYDNTDQSAGSPDPEVYLYASGPGSGSLQCLSCNPTGSRPAGPSVIPGASANGVGELSTRAYQPRVLVASGRRVFFESADRLLPGDTNNVADVYEWEVAGEGSCEQSEGCLTLISSGLGSEASTFIDASESGEDAFFLTDDSLVPSLDFGSYDIYDARVNGGFPVPEVPTACEGDACQPLPSSPVDPSPGTLVGGAPNPALHFPPQRCGTSKKRRARCEHHHHRSRHHKRRSS